MPDCDHLSSRRLLQRAGYYHAGNVGAAAVYSSAPHPRGLGCPFALIQPDGSIQLVAAGGLRAAVGLALAPAAANPLAALAALAVRT